MTVDMDGPEEVGTAGMPPGPGVGGGGTAAFGRDEILTTIIDASPVGVCVTTEDGLFEHVNPAYLQFYGYDAEELIGQHFTLVVPPEERRQLGVSHDRFIVQGGRMREECDVITRGRERKTILADACRVVGPDGRYRKVTFVVDITDRHRAEAALEQANSELAQANLRLAHMAAHDSLTGLPNHHRSHELLIQAMEVAERYGRELSVALVDLDHFKGVNDTFGHMEGDQVLIEFARRLQIQLRAVDTGGRVGGEEFLVVLPETSPAGAGVVLDRLRTACWDHVRTPDGHPVEFSAGVAGFVVHDTPDMLLRRADEALYRAKTAGRSRTEIG